MIKKQDYAAQEAKCLRKIAFAIQALKLFIIRERREKVLNIFARLQWYKLRLHI